MGKRAIFSTAFDRDPFSSDYCNMLQEPVRVPQVIALQLFHLVGAVCTLVCQSSNTRPTCKTNDFYRLALLFYLSVTPLAMDAILAAYSSGIYNGPITTPVA